MAPGDHVKALEKHLYEGDLFIPENFLKQPEPRKTANQWFLLERLTIQEKA